VIYYKRARPYKLGEQLRWARAEMLDKFKGWRTLFLTVPIGEDSPTHSASAPNLQRSLGATHLVLMGIGVTVGAGIFVVIGGASALFAGPAVVLSFLLAGLACGFSAMCYAEFASLMPVSGSAYAYAYATLGEIVAWAIGWNLILEYVFAASYVAVGWSAYVVSLLKAVGIAVPATLASAPILIENGQVGFSGAILNLPAALIVFAAALIARRGIKLSAIVNSSIVVTKLIALALFVVFGARYINVRNWSPFIPPNTGEFGHFGWSGVLRGAGVVFVAYLGFDAIATTAQETKNPHRNLPIGIIGSLLICAIFYAAVSLVLTGLVPYRALDVANPLSVALRASGGQLAWLTPFVDLAAVFGLASVVLVLMLAQPRVLLAMGVDGLLPKAFAQIHQKFRTPSFATLMTALSVAILAGLFPIDVLVQLVSVGTLSVFMAVCLGILVLRKRHPGLHRPFRVPFAPLVAPLGGAICAYLLVGLPRQTWALYGAWTLFGVLIYAGFGRRSARRTRSMQRQASPGD
jgi:APA family basic amino acid/polyamine antiporter